MCKYLPYSRLNGLKNGDMRYSELVELAKIVSRNKIKQIEIIGTSGKADSDHERLYRDLQEEKYAEEPEAVRAFYGENPHRKRYFSRLKSNLREKLINTLFFVDAGQVNFSDAQHAYYSCYRYAVAVKILLGRAGRKAAIPLAEYALRRALKYEFTDIVLTLANELRYHYGVMQGNKRKFREYNLLVKKYSEIQQVELKLEERYTQLGMHFSASKEARPEIYDLARQYSEYAEQQIEQYQSYRLNLYAYSIITLQYQVINDHPRLLESCERALRYFEGKKKLVPTITRFLFAMRTIPSLIMLKKYEKAELRIQHCLGLVQKGSLNYFKALEYYIIACLHSEQYEKAAKVNELAHNSRGFNKQYASSSEYWKLYEAYLHLFWRMGKIKMPKDKTIRIFKLGKFLNEVPNYSKDKRGANITILVLQFLFLLQQKQYGAIIDKADALRMYTSRYLRKNETFRSNCFLKMLLLLPNYSFNKKAVLARSANLERRLREMPISEVNQSLEVEVLPYEKLWEVTLELL